MRVIDAGLQGLWPLDLRTHFQFLFHLQRFKNVHVCVHASKANTFLIVSLAQTPYLAGLLLPYRTFVGSLGQRDHMHGQHVRVATGHSDFLRCYLSQLAWPLGSACPSMARSCYSARLRVLIGMPYQGLKLKIKYSEHQCFLDD